MMKSVGEVMAIGRTFKEAFMKAIRSLEIDTYGLTHPYLVRVQDDTLIRNLRVPNPDRVWYIAEAFRRGYSVEDVYEYTKIDRWFLHNIKQIVDFERVIIESELDNETLRRAKELGYSDLEIAKLKNLKEDDVRELRGKSYIVPAFKGVDTCAGEFVAYTPYYYSTYERPYYTIDGECILDEDQL